MKILALLRDILALNALVCVTLLLSITQLLYCCADILSTLHTVRPQTPGLILPRSHQGVCPQKKKWSLLTSLDRLQPIKYARYHPLITATTSPRNRPDQATAVDVKLTQIHQDEFPFFTSLISSHQHRPINEPSRLSRWFPVRCVSPG